MHLFKPLSVSNKATLSGMILSGVIHLTWRVFGIGDEGKSRSWSRWHESSAED